jgi:hypothetical protein
LLPYRHLRTDYPDPYPPPFPYYPLQLDAFHVPKGKIP